MNIPTCILVPIVSLTAFLCCGMSAHGWAEAATRKAISIDNDMFAFRGHDRDYTGGARLSLTAAGTGPEGSRAGDRVLDWLDALLPALRTPQPAPPHRQDRTLGFGLIAFAPEDLAATRPKAGERPYANLLYLATSRFTPSADGRNAFQSTLTVGLLGTPVAEWAHQTIHRTTGATVPRGYSTQLSDGGEPTVRYAAARHRFLHVRHGSLDRDVRLRIEGSAGYVTGVGTSMTGRLGRFPAGGWSLRSEQAGYLTQPYAPPPLRSGDWVLWASVGAQAQLYSSLLHGQFRQRERALGPSETRTLVVEWGMGLSWAIGGRTTVDYALRGRTREITTTAGGRTMRWGSVTLTHHLER